MSDTSLGEVQVTETPVQVEETNRKKLRGFASMTPERRREIASRGGKNAQANGKAHRWTPEEAAAAGRKGGARAQETKKAHELTYEETRKGGIKSAELRKAKEAATETLLEENACQPNT